MQKRQLTTLVTQVLAHAAHSGRAHLPWRHTKDPYAIWVSEVMLQQTQVDRALPKYAAFLGVFPTVAALAAAPLRDVLELWQGLGYNRRAKFLHHAAKEVVSIHKGVFPIEVALLEKLAGIGPYTARAVVTFAYNRPEVFIETNIRTVFFHFLYPTVQASAVSDMELLPSVTKALELALVRGATPAQWYGALMDYGAMLKKQGVRLNSTSTHYVKQSKFTGSNRELRGALLRALLKGAKTQKELHLLSKRTPQEVSQVVSQLLAENLIVKKGRRYIVAA